MAKWDWRSSMKNIYLDQCSVHWYVKHKFTEARFWADWAIKIDLIEKINSSSDVAHQTDLGNVANFPKIEDLFKKEVTWKKNRKIENWFLKIPENWNYFINFFFEFFHWSGRNINNIKKLYWELQRYNKNWDLWWTIMKLWKYTINVPDMLSWTSVQQLEAGMKLWIRAWVKTIDDCLVKWTIIAVKL